jgi:hypothetical protein
MTHQTHLPAAALLAAGLLLSGCAETTFEVPKTPNPVMLGPVDRIGGRVADPGEKSLGLVLGKAEFVSVANTTTEKHGKVTVQKTEGYSSKVTAGPFIKSVLEKTDGQDERTVRLGKLMVMGYFLHIGGYAELKQQITAAGDVVAPPAAPASPAVAPAPETAPKTEVAHVAR